MPCICNPSLLKVVARESEIQSQSQLKKLKTNQGLWTLSKKTKLKQLKTKRGHVVSSFNTFGITIFSVSKINVAN